jgi:aerotolerance regulator-like protein
VSFLAPIYLALAGAIAIPLLIHLLRRRIGNRVEFPAARYIARAEQEHSRRLRLRNLLVMALRVLAVLLVAAAAARPVGRMVGGGHAPTALAIVLDNSLSTTAIVGGRPILDRLKERARAAALRATATDRLWLITADGRVAGGGAGTIIEAIDGTAPLSSAGDLPAAIARAASVVSSAGLAERQVAVLTDGQASSWRTPLSLGETPIVIYAPPERPPENRAVIAAEARPVRWTPHGAVVARLQTRDSATFRITLAGRTLARGTAGSDGEITVRAAPAERGWTAGTVELEPDELRGDDVRHFAVWLGPPPRVRLDPATGSFVRTAIDALVESERLVTVGGPGDAEIAVTTADALGRLPALIVAPSEPVRIGAANRALERAGIPWRFGALQRGTQSVRGDRLDDVTTTLRYSLQLHDGAAATDTLATAGGEPWIVAGNGWVLVGSPLDPSATSLPIRAAFVPWLTDVITQRLSGAEGTVVTASPFARVARPAWAETLERPDGTRLPIGSAIIETPARPGVYFLLRGTERAGALVVNAEAEESILDRLPERELRARVKAEDVHIARTADRWSSVVFASAVRHPLVSAFLAAALLALLGETVLSGARRTQPT